MSLILRTRATALNTTKQWGSVMLISSVLTGCAVGPDFKRPDVPTGQNLTRETMTMTSKSDGPTGVAQNFVPGAQVRQDWWRLYESPLLNELIEHALEQSPTVQAAQASLKQAQALANSQRAGFFPTVQAGYLPMSQNTSNTIAPVLNSGENPFTLNTLQLSVGFNIDAFGLNRRTVEALDAQSQNQKFLLDATNVTLATTVVSTVVQLAGLQAQLSATQDLIEASKQALDILKGQEKLGFVSAIDVAAQETLLAQNEQLLPPLRKQLEQTRNQLAVLVGRLPSDAGSENFNIDELQLPQSLPLSLPSQIVEQRPDIRAAEALLHSASAQVGVAVASRLPQLSISAAMGGMAVPFNQLFTNNNQFWTVGGSITQTLLDFGGLKYRQDAAEAALAVAGAQYKTTVLTAFQNIADTMYALDADAKALGAASKAETAAKKIYDLTMQQLKIGHVNTLTMLLAQQTYLQAMVTRVQAQANRLLDTAALFQSLGGGWSS